MAIPEVSIHAPAWGATAAATLANQPRQGFNPRARVGRDVVADRAIREYCRFQSTRPRGARLVVGRTKDSIVFVSIHAPAWGATACIIVNMVYTIVSIHAPAWGATGCRANRVWRNSVSIHAPAWGATQRRLFLISITQFQSTRPRGARQFRFCNWKRIHRFQSTRPRGARRSGAYS